MKSTNAKHQTLKGEILDSVGLGYGIIRYPGCWYWPFKESDKRFRKRCLATIRNLPLTGKDVMKKIKDVTLIDITTILIVVGFLVWAIWEARHGS